MKKLAEMGYVAGENGGQQMGVRGVVVSGFREEGVLEERESDDEVEREGGRRWQRGLGCAREQGSRVWFRVGETEKMKGRRRHEKGRGFK